MALSKIDVANMLTGEVPNANVATVGVAKGGTGLRSGTSGQFLKFTGSTTLASTAISTGKIGQVIEGDVTTHTTVSSTSYVDVWNPLDSHHSLVSAKILYDLNEDIGQIEVGGGLKSTSAVTGIRFIAESGATIDAGTFRIYGFK